MVGLRVTPFAYVHVPDVALLVDEVIGRPVVVPVGVPGAVVVVECNRVADAEALDRRTHVAKVVLERKLGCVHADDDETP